MFNRIKLYLQKVKPQHFFLLVAIPFGLLFIIINPPFQVPDEPHHFYKAWQISEGQFISLKNNQRVGGYIPKSIEHIATLFSYMTYNSEKMKMKEYSFAGFLKIPL